jgi:hypothetical protein
VLSAPLRKRHSPGRLAPGASSVDFLLVTCRRRKNNLTPVSAAFATTGYHLNVRYRDGIGQTKSHPMSRCSRGPVGRLAGVKKERETDRPQAGGYNIYEPILEAMS